MKLQHLAIIFVIIIVPISLVMSSYMQNQIEAIRMQTAFDQNLINATYDAVKAFQINTTNNKYSSISNSKIRDIEAAINTFYNTLNTSMSGYSIVAKDLKGYTPAILFTLYDGYYIYSSYNNVYSKTEEEQVEVDLNKKNYNDGLKPYIYYSAKYSLPIPGKPNNIIIINYTLDNEITVYGDVGDGQGYVTKSGYLINPNDVIQGNNKITYNGVDIFPEELTEHLITIENQEDNTTKEDDYRYIFYQNKKVYQDKNQDGWLYYNENGEMTNDTNGVPVIFWYDNYMKTYVNDSAIREYAEKCKMQSISAYEYYLNAKSFSQWVNQYLGDITQANLIREDTNERLSNDVEYLSDNTNGKIFNTIDNNDPMLSGSIFNNHRLAIIRKTIETSLNTIISNYKATTLYDYAMPVISDEDWYKILNNVSMVTFLQGMSIGYRIYNNYTVVTNNVNKEVVKAENIYIVAENTVNNSREYHQPGCKELLEGIKNKTLKIVGAYPTASFQRQSVKITENSDDDLHFYYQAREKKTLTGCYNCIVNATANYKIDDIIEGNDLIDYDNQTSIGGNGQISFSKDDDEYKKVRTAYLTALARERYDLYKSNFDLQ